jgi:hypothetical protein
MNSLRKVFGLLMALTIAAVALPAAAQTSNCPSPSKCYSVDVHPNGSINSNVPASSTTSANVVVTITNETPQTGVSTINSFIITPPAGVTVVDPATTADNPGMTAVMQGGSVYVNGFNGLKSGQKAPYYLSVKLRVTYPTTMACLQSFTWNAIAFNGNSFGNTNYTFIQVVGTGTSGVTNQPTNATQTVACSYSFSGLASSIAKGTSVPATVSVTNSGSVAITQFSLTASGGLQVSPAGPYTVNIPPGPTPTAIPVTITAPCGSGTTGGAWSTSVQPSGFSTTSTASTSVTGDCKVVFTSQPNTALDGAVVTNTYENNPPGSPVQVQLKLGDGSNAPDGTSVSMSGGSCSITAGNTATTSGGLATFSNLTMGAGTGCQLTASAAGFTSGSSTGTFSILPTSGRLACSGTVLSGNVNQPGYYEVLRGAQNKDGSCNTSVSYILTNKILDPTNPSFAFTWDTTTGTGEPYAAFSYTVNWAIEDTTSSSTPGWPNAKNVKVAWYTDSLGNPIYIRAQSCTSESLPATLTTLSVPLSNAGGSGQTMTVTSTPAGLTAPFAVVVGTERMLVTAISGNSWTVNRGDTQGTAVAGHSAGALVMSTPLPLLTSWAVSTVGTLPVGVTSNPYVAGKPAHMCVWAHGFVGKGINPSSGAATVMYTTSAFDIGGDGWMAVD